MTTNGLRDSWEEDDTRNVPVVIVHGLTESEVHEAANLLAKSREVCVHERWDSKENGPTFTFVTDCGKVYDSKEVYTRCACGASVKPGARV